MIKDIKKIYNLKEDMNNDNQNKKNCFQKEYDQDSVVFYIF